MPTPTFRPLATITIVAALVSMSVTAQGRHGHDVPSLPPGLDVPEGHTLFLATRAAGTQNYICLQTATGIAWRFLGPQATLFATHGNTGAESAATLRQQVATHFLSANPSEPGVARATWQHSTDTSRVWARAIASSADPAYVEPGAIPWLLLEVVGAEPGPIGGTSLAATTFIHRLNTSGGVAPSGGCSSAADVGTTALVPYTTDYLFYRADGGRNRE